MHMQTYMVDLLLSYSLSKKKDYVQSQDDKYIFKGCGSVHLCPPPFPVRVGSEVKEFAPIRQKSFLYELSPFQGGGRGFIIGEG